MAKAKTTIYVDEDLLRGARVYAARKDMKDSEVFELALRRILGRDVLDDIWARNSGVDPELAEQVAYEELNASRRR
ncbi:MAG: hypothetical protein ACOYNJ_11420 [Candidatus Nanopelagicales bacterium]|jgi:hypothetical protein